MELTNRMAGRIDLWKIDRLKPYEKNARTHSTAQIKKIVASIEKFGFNNPILIGAEGGVIAGHGRLEAAKHIGLEYVPVVILDHLNEKQRREYVLADNRIALDAGWDEALLRQEIGELADLECDLGTIGFSDEELEALLSEDDPTAGTPDASGTDEGASEDDDEDPTERGELQTDEAEPESVQADPEETAAPIPLSAPRRVFPGQAWKLGRHLLVCGDSGDAELVHRHIGEHEAHAIVSDPPYGLGQIHDLPGFVGDWIAGGSGDEFVGKSGFMGKWWDRVVPPPSLWKTWLSRARPGAHALVFSGTRTQDLMTLSLRISGVEIRDMCAWLYGQGFPKSLDISKAIDNAAGVTERPITGPNPSYSSEASTGHTGWVTAARPEFKTGPATPATPAALQWDGWGTALKPALEPITLARIPLSEKTVAENVLRWGTGGINVDGCRIGTGEPLVRPQGQPVNAMGARTPGTGRTEEPQGRFPANLLLDAEAAAALDAQSGTLTSGGTPPSRPREKTRNTYGSFAGNENPDGIGSSSGGASRFFYCAKASKSDRNMGLEEIEGTPAHVVQGGKEGSAGSKNPRAGITTKNANHHPTVKPLRLMEYLVRLVTPPGGIVLEPFCGSGTTLLACEREGFSCRAFEMNPEYCDIILARFETLTGITPECVSG